MVIDEEQVGSDHGHPDVPGWFTIVLSKHQYGLKEGRDNLLVGAKALRMLAEQLNGLLESSGLMNLREFG